MKIASRRLHFPPQAPSLANEAGKSNEHGQETLRSDVFEEDPFLLQSDLSVQTETLFQTGGCFDISSDSIGVDDYGFSPTTARPNHRKRLHLLDP